MARPLSIQDVARMLRWESAGIDLPLWQSEYESFLDHRLRDRAHANDDYICIVQALELLPVASRRRFLRAPAVSSLLLQGDARGEAEAHLLAVLLLAEIAALGIAVELPDEPIWTARGDRLISRAISGSEPVAEVLLANTGITLDLASPFPFPDDEFGIAETVHLLPAERTSITSRLLTAVEVLQSIAREMLDFVSTFIEVLAVRREPKDSQVFYSSSFSGFVGLTRFTNAHLEYVDTALLAENLIHEAIHGMLYMYEEVCDPFVLTHEANKLAVISPWTGATIKLQSLVQACAVWYGVYWFLRQALERGVIDGKCPYARMDLALQGFQRQPVSKVLSSHSALLRPEIVDLLTELEGVMRTV